MKTVLCIFMTVVLGTAIMTQAQGQWRLGWGGTVSIQFGQQQSNCYGGNTACCNTTYWQPPVCDNAGNSIQRISQRCCCNVLVRNITVCPQNINSTSCGCFVDGMYHQQGYTINLVVDNMPRSIPISENDLRRLQNNQTITVQVVW